MKEKTFKERKDEVKIRQEGTTDSYQQQHQQEWQAQMMYQQQFYHPQYHQNPHPNVLTHGQQQHQRQQQSQYVPRHEQQGYQQESSTAPFSTLSVPEENTADASQQLYQEPKPEVVGQPTSLTPQIQAYHPNTVSVDPTQDPSSQHSQSQQVLYQQPHQQETVGDVADIVAEEDIVPTQVVTNGIESDGVPLPPDDTSFPPNMFSNAQYEQQTVSVSVTGTEEDERGTAEVDGGPSVEDLLKPHHHQSKRQKVEEYSKKSQIALELGDNSCI